MRIIKSNVQENREQNYKKEEFIECVLDQIFMIAKSDDNFKIAQKIDESDKTIKSLEKKIIGKNELLKKSEKLKKEFKEKVSNIENQNFKMKMNLLESLGADI